MPLQTSWQCWRARPWGKVVAQKRPRRLNRSTTLRVIGTRHNKCRLVWTFHGLPVEAKARQRLRDLKALALASMPVVWPVCRTAPRALEFLSATNAHSRPISLRSLLVVLDLVHTAKVLHQALVLLVAVPVQASDWTHV